jgi:TetR/AcrR family transcriptional repressor of nem operon
MPRPARTFWTHGYEATSIDDLLEMTGMHRGSFYRVFGDKRSAFQAALDRYGEVVGDRHVLPAVGGRGSPCRRLLVLLYARLDAALGLSGEGPAGEDGRGPGCLVVNTAIELGPHDDQARAAVAASLDALRSAVRWLVDEAVAAGEVDAGIAASSPPIRSSRCCRE